MLLAGCSDPYRTAEDAVRAKLADPAAADFSGLKPSRHRGQEADVGGSLLRPGPGQDRGRPAWGGPELLLHRRGPTDRPLGGRSDLHAGDAVIIDDTDQSPDGVDAKSMQLALCRGGTETNPVPTILWE